MVDGKEFRSKKGSTEEGENEKMLIPYFDIGSILLARRKGSSAGLVNKNFRLKSRTLC